MTHPALGHLFLFPGRVRVIVSEPPPNAICGNPEAPSPYNLPLLSLSPPSFLLCFPLFVSEPISLGLHSCCVSSGWHCSGSLTFHPFLSVPCICFLCCCVSISDSISLCIYLSVSLSLPPCIPSLTSESPSSWFSESPSSISGSPGVSWPLGSPLSGSPKGDQPTRAHCAHTSKVCKLVSRVCLGLPLSLSEPKDFSDFFIRLLSSLLYPPGLWGSAFVLPH